MRRQRYSGICNPHLCNAIQCNLPRREPEKHTKREITPCEVRDDVDLTHGQDVQINVEVWCTTHAALPQSSRSRTSLALLVVVGHNTRRHLRHGSIGTAVRRIRASEYVQLIVGGSQNFESIRVKIAPSSPLVQHGPSSRRLGGTPQHPPPRIKPREREPWFR